MNSTFIICKFHKLEHYLLTFLKHNTAVDAPYHNFFHSCCVIENSRLIANSVGLPRRDIRELLIAGIFHDFNHSQGKKSDKENIEDAIKAFLKYSQESDEANDKIESIIRATEYPYVIPENSLNLSQKIIRDADMMQMFEKNYMQQIIFGLLIKELNMTFEKALEAQLKFMEGVKFHTEYAQDISKSLLQSRIDGITRMKNLCH